VERTSQLRIRISRRSIAIKARVTSTVARRVATPTADTAMKAREGIRARRHRLAIEPEARAHAAGGIGNEDGDRPGFELDPAVVVSAVAPHVMALREAEISPAVELIATRIELAEAPEQRRIMSARARRKRPAAE
jgi:hypothetical protein